MNGRRRRTERPVAFRFAPPGPVSFVELRGEMTDFARPVAMRPCGGGLHEARCSLGPGTYSYKLRTSDGAWHLDPSSPRSRSLDGTRNSLLVVDGADEPLLHAPAPPWVHREDDGRLAVRAGLRRGEGDSLEVRWDEGAGASTVRMELRAEEDEHLLFEACLPVSARRVDYLFVLPSGRLAGAPGGAGQAFGLAPAGLARPVPDWWKEAVLYTVFVDRFRRGGSEGRWEPRAEGLAEDAAAGGDLDGVIEALGHIESLGASAIHLTPVSLSGSAHRYDAIDPRRVDPRLGGEPALARLVEAAHGRGIRVLLDLAVTHVHRDFPPFRDVAIRGPASPFWGWFLVHRHPFHEGIDPGYEHYQKGRWQEPLLDTTNEGVAEHLVETFAALAGFGVDGFRIDAAADLPLALLERICDAVHAARADAVVFGEVIPEHLHRYLDHGLDAATDFAGQQVLLDWLARGRCGAREAAARYARRRFSVGGPGYRAIGFTATHDQHRLLTRTGDSRRVRLATLLVLARPEVPALYYGDEVGLAAERPDRDFEGAWPDRQPMPWDEASWELETLELVRAGAAARRASRALSVGDLVDLEPIGPDGAPAGDEVLAFRRVAGGEVVDVLLNAGERPAELALPAGASSGARLLVAAGRASVDSVAGRLQLGPVSGALVARVPATETREAFDELVAHNRLLGEAAWREGRTALLAAPAHLYLTVTEECNLRCAHCITHAPRRTRNRTARTMRPWLLDALGEAFAAAEYFGFSHGGEALCSPVLADVLARIVRARQGRPGRTDVHLLTNGMLLDRERASRLVDLGVTSIALSLDGARPETNDLLRLGASFERIVANLSGCVRLRESRGADLRLGISWVVGQSNVAELPVLARLAADLGVDWVKVEEMFPATERARREMLPPGDPRLTESMAALLDGLEAAQIVLVDHLAPPTGCWCEGAARPALRAFREADDFASRARFNPCRLAWEQACVDPDGTVRAVDYDQPPLGNLLESGLPALWNGAIARRLRGAALERIAPSFRRACRGR